MFYVLFIWYCRFNHTSILFVSAIFVVHVKRIAMCVSFVHNASQDRDLCTCACGLTNPRRTGKKSIITEQYEDNNDDGNNDIDQNELLTKELETKDNNNDHKITVLWCVLGLSERFGIFYFCFFSFRRLFLSIMWVWFFFLHQNRNNYHLHSGYFKNVLRMFLFFPLVILCSA